MSDDEEDLLRISTRMERIQVARMLVHQGRYEKALPLLRSVREQYVGKDEAKVEEIDRLIAKAEQELAS